MEIKFKCVYDPQTPLAHTVVVKTQSETLDDVILVFEDFLRGCGYHLPIDSHLEFISKEE